MAAKKGRPPEVERLRREAGSNDPVVAECARRTLSEMGRKGGTVTAKRRREKAAQDARQLSLDIEAYRRASRGS